MNKDNKDALLVVNNLKVHFPILGGLFSKKQGVIKAVDGVTFSVERGTTVGLVGESGSGKTTIGRSIVKLVEKTLGEIIYNGQDIGSMSSSEFFPFRKKIQMIFQDPFNSLNPRMKVFDIISEPLDIHFPNLSKKDKENRVKELLEYVRLNPGQMMRYPHEFSGGQRQRIGIARALAVEPEFIICDEPVSALDVSVQAEIVNLLQDLQKDFGLTYLFIAHDLAVVQHMSHKILVMTAGKIVEQANPATIYKDPAHVYTKKLLEAIPVL